MKTFSGPAQRSLTEPVMQAEPTLVLDARPIPRWLASSRRRCCCSRCGTHAYRRLRPDGAGPLDPSGAPATCTVCGGAPLLPMPGA